MDSTTPSPQERAEVELVLQSGIFLKAPRLARFFRYVCERHLEGSADQIKEYSIAFEALNRSPEFDPKKDSIVRVEAHRLRKRLEEYYRGPGATHSIQISIPNGQYRPCFTTKHVQTIPQEVLIAAAQNGRLPPIASPVKEYLAPVGLPDAGSRETLPAGRKRRASKWFWFAAFCAAGVMAVWISFAARPKNVPMRQNEEVWTGSVSEPVPSEFRMAAGYHGAPFVDSQGHSWGPDAYYNGGVSAPLPSGSWIEGSPDAQFLRAERSGSFRYAIPLRQGTYELHLYFAETEYGRSNPKGGGDGSRIFQVKLNDATLLKEFDPLGEAGAANRLHERVFKNVTTAKDGALHLAFDGLVGPAFLNAIAILPSAPGRVHPIRIVAQPNPVTDSDGRVWAADEYYCGGTFVSRRKVVFNGADKVLFQGERYGNFVYHLPLPSGKYRLTLHFAETYFGLPGSSGPAVGSRLFNVFVNGEALLRNFEIAEAAGGANRTISKSFDNLEPNAQGVLAVEFVPVRKYAEVNAIEVVQAD